MKRKLFILMIIVLVLTGCTLNDDSNVSGYTQRKNNNIYLMDDIADEHYILENTLSVYPYENRFFVANGDSVGYYNTADMQYTSLASIPAEQITVNKDEIIVRDGNKISALDRNGTVTAEWTVDDINIEDDYVRMCASDEYIAVSYGRSADENSVQSSQFLTAVRRSDGAVVTLELTGERIAYNLMSIRYDNDTRFIILSTYHYENDTTLYSGVFEYNAEAQNFQYLYDFDGGICADYVDGSVYSFTRFDAALQFVETYDRGEKSRILRNIRYETVQEQAGALAESARPRYYVSTLFCTGSDYILWDSETHVLSVYNMRNSVSGQTLNVCYPNTELTDDILVDTNVGSMNYALMRFEELYDCSVDAQMITAAEFPERLRMKLLAGDEDLDIIHMDHCNEGDLLAAILRYQLYLPLENETEITDNYAAFADGVQEYMTYDGHLIGIPYAFGDKGILVTDEYLETDLPVPDTAWTIDDFWNICEAAVDYCTDGTALTQHPYHWIIKAIIQNGVNAGKMDRDAVLDAVEKLYRYNKSGVFADRRDADTFLLENRVYLPAQCGRSYSEKYYGQVVSNPTVAGKRYAPLDSFVFAYQKTDSRELAVNYLAMLSGNEFAPMVSIGKTFFMKDHESYYSMERRVETLDQWTRWPALIQGNNASLVKITSDVFPGTSMLTLDEPSADETIADVFKRLYADEITPEQAADEIVSYANYRYFE